MYFNFKHSSWILFYLIYLGCCISVAHNWWDNIKCHWCWRSWDHWLPFSCRMLETCLNVWEFVCKRAKKCHVTSCHCSTCPCTKWTPPFFQMWSSMTVCSMYTVVFTACIHLSKLIGIWFMSDYIQLI